MAIVAVILSGFVLGFALHILLYDATASLPVMWRNITRYFVGVGSVLILAAVALALRPDLDGWQVYELILLLFATTGVGVIAGYIHTNGNAKT